MRALVIGDCHGEMPEIPDDDFDLVMCVGDICGGTGEMRSAMFEAIESEKPWYELFGVEEAKEAVKNSIGEGKEILGELDSLGVPVFVVPGNWDWTGENSDWNYLNDKGYPQMLEGFDNIHDLNFDSRKVGGWSFVGYGPCSGPEVPQYEDDEPDSEEELQEIKREYEDKKNRLRELFGGGKVVLLSHNVPQGTSLDLIDDEDNPKDGRHYGSLIVRELLEEFSPEFNIAGHMHEREGKQEVEDTLCLNTGLNTVWVLDSEEGISKFS